MILGVETLRCPMLKSLSFMALMLTHLGFSKIQKVDYQFVQDATKDANVIIFDARTDKYFDQQVIPNAKHLPGNSTDQKIDEILKGIPKERKIIVYCGGIECPASEWLSEKLDKKGYTNIFEYKGGIEEWRKKGQATENYPLKLNK